MVVQLSESEQSDHSDHQVIVNRAIWVPKRTAQCSWCSTKWRECLEIFGVPNSVVFDVLPQTSHGKLKSNHTICLNAMCHMFCCVWWLEIEPCHCLRCRYGGFLSHRGTLFHHPFIDGISYDIKHLFWGSPMTMEPPIWFHMIPYY